MTRITPSERFRCELDEALAGVDGEADPVETISRLGAKLILQQVLESEVELFLGRARYERTEEPVAYRNGYERRTVRTTSGPIGLERPRLRGASELGFASVVLGKGVARTHALEALVVLSFLRGLSVRDVEALLAEALGEQVVSKSTVSRICEQTRERYRAWCERDLAEHDLVYCFLDALYLKLRPDDEPAEGVLCAWGLTLEGRKVLLGLQLGSRESYEDWLDFARDLTARGLRCPALVTADGAPGLWKAVAEAWPAALGQRCTVHKLRNLLAKLPERLHREVKAATGPPSTRLGRRRRRRRPCRRSPATTAERIPPSAARSRRTSTPWSSTCASPASIASGSAAPICSSAPSSRSGGGRR